MPVMMFFIVLAVVLSGAGLGLYMATVLPKHHVSEQSKDIVRAFMEVNGLLSAVVLGLLIFSAKTSFDIKDTEWKHASANIVLLDRLLAQYGQETNEARQRLRAAVAAKLAQLETSGAPQGELVIGLDDVQRRIGELSPATDAQHWLKAKALDVSSTIAQARWFLLDEIDSTMPMPFLAVMVFWLALIFFSYGLFMPRNATVVVIVFLCAVALAASVFLIMEMDQSIKGVISISAAPLRESLANLGQ